MRALSFRVRFSVGVLRRRTCKDCHCLLTIALLVLIGFSALPLVVHSTFGQTAPSFVVGLTNQYPCIGGNAIFYVEATGTPPIDFFWVSNNVTVLQEFNQTNSTLTISNVQPWNNGDLIKAYATSPYGFTQSMANLIVYDPQICQQPNNVTAPVGPPIFFNVNASGTPPLFYRWYFQGNPMTNGPNVSGANSPNLVINSAQASNSGTYKVVITNFISAITSRVAQCFIGIPPTVGSLTSRIVRIGTSTTFTNTYTGTTPLSYQWYRNDVPVPGAISSIFTIGNVQRTNIGLYHVVVTNAFGVAISSKAHLQARLTLEGTSPVFREEATDEIDSLTNAVPAFVPPPTAIYHGVPLLFTTYGATAQSWEVNPCNPSPSHTMWVRYQAPRAELTKVSTEGSGFDTIVSVYVWDNNPNHNPGLVDCNDNGGFDGETSLLFFPTTAGVTYYIAVDGVAGVTGTVRLQVGENIRRVNFNPANSQFRFELAGSYWKDNTLRSATNFSSPIFWQNLIVMPATNKDWVLGYTNSTVYSSPARYYNLLTSP